MKFILQVLFLTGIVCLAHGQVQVDPDCDNYQFLSIGQTYYIYNPTYPNYYRPNTRCRWMAQVPVGYKIKLDCNDILIPQSQNCAGDRLSVSLSGNPNFVDGQNYCGTGTLYLTSTTTSMSIGLFSLPNTPGGKMSCSIYAIVDQNPTPPTSKPPTCDCGWQASRRIVGGTETGVNQYPFAAALIDSDQKLLLCGATIIHYHYAVTAAHCVRNRDASILGLLVGDHDYASGTETQSAALYRLQSYISQSYDVNNHQNDIAIVRTQIDMAFSMEVGPACLPFKYTSTNFVNSNVLVMGWGSTEFSGPQSQVLLAANLSVVSNAYCQSEHNGLNPIFPTQICTYTVDKDACQSDSGGPLAYHDSGSNRYFLVGVVSYGIGCGMEYPGVNTRVTSYMTWIVNNTPDASYCIK